MKNQRLKIIGVSLSFTTLIAILYLIYGSSFPDAPVSTLPNYKRSVTTFSYAKSDDTKGRSRVENSPSSQERSVALIELKIQNAKKEFVNSEKLRSKTILQVTGKAASIVRIAITKPSDEERALMEKQIDNLEKLINANGLIEKYTLQLLELNDFIHWNRNSETKKEYGSRSLHVATQVKAGGEDALSGTLFESQDSTLKQNSDGTWEHKLIGDFSTKEIPTEPLLSRFGYLFTVTSE